MIGARPTDFLIEPMSQAREGESGSWFGMAPNEAKALATALAISPPTGMIAPSPAPLTPSGLLSLSRRSRNQRGDSIVRRCQSCREPDDGVAHGAL